MESENKESKSNGMELLENVVKSNMENIEQNIKLQFAIEDHTTLLNDLQISLEEGQSINNEIVSFFKSEQAKRAEFLANVPTKIETVLSQETIYYYESFREKIKRMEKCIWSGIGVAIFALLLLIVSINFATNWYKESIRSKSEIREEILKEIAGEGKKIYDEKDMKNLSENTQIMQLWIKNNSKEAKDFLRFKDGFEANKENK